jgi:hypothetical protein
MKIQFLENIQQPTSNIEQPTVFGAAASLDVGCYHQI